MYETYLENPNNVPAEWRTYFEKLPRVDGVIASDVPHSTVIRHFELIGRNRLRARPQSVATEVANEHERKQIRVTELISAYRHRGHKRATIDPLGMMERPATPVLDLAYHHLSAADLDTVFQTGTFFYGAEKATLRDIVAALEHTYCGSVGAEYMHIVDTAEQLWVQQRLESVRCHPEYGDDVKRMILERLTAARGSNATCRTNFPARSDSAWKAAKA